MPLRLVRASRACSSGKRRFQRALAAPDTVNTIPEKTLSAFAEHGNVEAPVPTDGGYADEVLEAFRREGFDDEALTARLQREGADAFAASWHVLLACIEKKSARPAATGA